MNIFGMNIIRTSIACFAAAVLIGANADAFAATPSPSHRAKVKSIGAGAPIVRARAHGLFEETLLADAITSGASANPGPLYGRYLGYHGYPGHYPCCYYSQAFDRAYGPYHYVYRTGSAQPTWWDYPVHGEGW
jgi:hypothetical protein